MAQETCCCGGMTVGQGSLAIGIINLVGSVLILGLNLVNIALRVEYEKSDRTALITVLVVGVFSSLIHLIVSILMVVGCAQRNHCLIMPWLIFSYISLCFLTLLGIVGIRAMIVQPHAGKLFCALLIAVAAAVGIVRIFTRVVERYVDELMGGAASRV